MVPVATNPSVYPQLVQLQIWSIFLGALLIDVDISSNVTSWDETIFDVLLVIIRGQTKQMISLSRIINAMLSNVQL